MLMKRCLNRTARSMEQRCPSGACLRLTSRPHGCGSTTGSACFRALWRTGASFHRRCHERSRVFLTRPQKLLAIEREFSTGDPVLVRTAVFGLLHAGRMSAPDLHTQALSLLTSFVATEAIS